LSSAARAAVDAGLLSFSPADAYSLTLTFDGGTRAEERDLRPVLPLILRW
jgi:hypothetical protein